MMYGSKRAVLLAIGLCDDEELVMLTHGGNAVCWCSLLVVCRVNAGWVLSRLSVGGRKQRFGNLERMELIDGKNEAQAKWAPGVV